MSERASRDTSKTNWARVDTLTDDEIDTSEIPPLSDEFFRRAAVRRPASVSVTVRLDPETLAWYEAQGEDGERRMAAALRIYAEAHKAD